MDDMIVTWDLGANDDMTIMLVVLMGSDEFLTLDIIEM